MNRTTFLAGSLALGMLAAAGADAQVYKCQDAKGKITYSGQPCADLGQKSAGEVKDSVSISPGMPVPAAKPEQSPRRPDPAAATAAEPAPAPKESAGENPNRRCFTVKTAKGTTTRTG